ncbi:hypothetical protein [Streptomyces sp. ECR3]|jgi:hypothetical protein|uniref:hypothetical protein n=1 Tax=Streptomyces sp. ECR3 TaxID=3400630 RepID=UPI003F1E0FE8
MDQGIAAVLGALVGVLGTAGTASLGYIAARKQAPDQGRIAHAQQLRAERREAYLAVMHADAECDDALLRFKRLRQQQDRDPAQMSALAARVQAAADRIWTMTRDIDLVGPEAVAGAVTDLWRRAVNTAETLMSFSNATDADEAAVDEMLDAMETGRAQFIVATRHVMESPPR